MNSTVSEAIRKKREKLGISIEKVTEKTRIPGKFLQAVEESRWEEFPSAFHRRSYLRLYLSYLKLPETLLEECQPDLFDQPREDAAEQPLEPGAGLPASRIILVVALAVVFLLVLILSQTLLRRHG